MPADKAGRSSSTLPPEARVPGWYPDETSQGDEAFWDGRDWTIRRRRDGQSWKYLPASDRPTASVASVRSARSRARYKKPLAIMVSVVAISVVVGLVLDLVAGDKVARSGLGQASPPSSGGAQTLSLTQPSFTQLERFVPGGINMSASVPVTTQAPLLCGGTTPSRLVGATVAQIPNSLSQISVLKFSFSTPAAAQAYLHAVLPTGVSVTNCKVPVADSGVFTPVSYFPGDFGIYEATGSTAFGSTGPYPYGRTWNTISYFAQGADAFVVRIDTLNGSPSQLFVDAVLGSMEAPGGPVLRGNQTRLSPVTAVLERAANSGQPPPTIQSAGAPWLDCPEAVVGSSRYNIVFENQLPNAQSAGLVVPSASGHGTTTLAWGTRIRMYVDTFGLYSNETTFGCGPQGGSLPNFANVIGLAPSA
jgi:hypothetical protein